MLLQPIKAGFRLARDGGGSSVKCVPTRFRLGRRFSLPVAGMRAARLLRRRMRGRLFPVCGFGLDALSFNLFHLAFFRRGAAAGLLRVSSCFLLFGFSFSLFPCLAGRLIRSRAGKRGEGPEGSGRSFQDGSLFFGFCPSPHSYTRIHSSLAQSVEHAAVNRRVVGSSPTGGATVKCSLNCCSRNFFAFFSPPYVSPYV